MQPFAQCVSVRPSCTFTHFHCHDKLNYWSEQRVSEHLAPITAGWPWMVDMLDTAFLCVYDADEITDVTFTKEILILKQYTKS